MGASKVLILVVLVHPLCIHSSVYRLKKGLGLEYTGEIKNHHLTESLNPKRSKNAASEAAAGAVQTSE